MPTFFNHAHYPIPEYQLHSPQKFADMAQYGGLDSGRALPCTLSVDIIQLDPRLRSQYDYLANHYRDVGLEIGQVIFDADPAAINRYPGYDFSVYGFNQEIHSIRPDERRLVATRAMHNKNQFIAWCVELGLPTPRTYVSSHGPVHDLADIRLPALIKPARSSEGRGIQQVTTAAELAACIAGIGDRFEYQVQEQVNGPFFSEQYDAGADGVSHLATTGQLFDGYKHCGNVWPYNLSARSIADQAAKAAQSRGLRGPFGFDVAIGTDGAQLVECNARYTAATYPLKTASRLGAGAWMSCKFPTDHTLLENVKISDLSYDPNISTGAVIMHAGQLLARERSLAFLIIGNPNDQIEIHRELEGRMRK